MRLPCLLAAAVLVSLPLAACVDDPHLPRPDPAAPNQAQLTRGRRLFAARCAVCHKLPAPGACTAGIMDAMAPEAGLKPDERAAVEAYIAAVRK